MLLVPSKRDLHSQVSENSATSYKHNRKHTRGRREYVSDYITGVRDHLSFFQHMPTFVKFAYFIDKRDDLIMDLYDSADSSE